MELVVPSKLVLLQSYAFIFIFPYFICNGCIYILILVKLFDFLTYFHAYEQFVFVENVSLFTKMFLCILRFDLFYFLFSWLHQLYAVSIFVMYVHIYIYLRYFCV